MRHLTETELQKLLDEGRVVNSDAHLHLIECELCYQQFTNYEMLSSALEQEVPDNLPTDFAQTVVTTIEEKRDREKIMPWDVLISIPGLILGFGWTLYFLLKNYLPEWSSKVAYLKEGILEFFAVLEHYFVNFNFVLFGSAVLVLILMTAFDNLIFQGNEKQPLKLQ